MRFIKLIAELEESPNGISIEFDKNINILQIDGKNRFEKIKNLFTESLLNLNSGKTGGLEQVNDFTLHAVYGGRNYRIESNGNIIPSPDSDGKNKSETDSSDMIKNPLQVYFNKVYRNNFPSLTCIQDGESALEPFQISSELLGRILADIDLIKESDSFRDEEEHALEKSKNLSALIKQKELIEIKKMRKDKLQKEIAAINRVLSRLSKKLKAFNDFKSTLNTISEKIALKNRLASKINNSKKEVLESRDLKSRFNTLEKELKAEFPQFKEYGKNLPSLEDVEGIFNDLKDINEKIDREKNSAEQLRKRGWKGVGAIIIFSVTSSVFLGIKGETSFIPYIAGAALLLCGTLVLASFLKLRNHDIESLIDEKKTHQLKLSSALENDRFTFDSYQTEELYEFLLQYFDDFIRYTELQSEIKSLEETISSQTPLRETEKKLESRSQEMTRIEKEIIREMKSLDPDIIRVDSEEDIENAFFEINELIDSAENEIRQEDSIRKKIESEILDYDRKDNSGTSYDHQLAEIEKQINDLEDDIKAISFMKDLTNDAVLSWTEEKLTLIAQKTWETMQFISEKTGTNLPADYRDRIDHIITIGGSAAHLKDIPENYIKIAVIHALGEISAAIHLLPPLIIVLTSHDDDNNNYLKNLLELFSEWQVIIIASAPVPGISGNLIKI